MQTTRQVFAQHHEVCVTYFYATKSFGKGARANAQLTPQTNSTDNLQKFRCHCDKRSWTASMRRQPPHPCSFLACYIRTCRRKHDGFYPDLRNDHLFLSEFIFHYKFPSIFLNSIYHSIAFMVFFGLKNDRILPLSRKKFSCMVTWAMRKLRNPVHHEVPCDGYEDFSIYSNSIVPTVCLYCTK